MNVDIRTFLNLNLKPSLQNCPEELSFSSEGSKKEPSLPDLQALPRLLRMITEHSQSPWVKSKLYHKGNGPRTGSERVTLEGWGDTLGLISSNLTCGPKQPVTRLPRSYFLVFPSKSQLLKKTSFAQPVSFGVGVHQIFCFLPEPKGSNPLKRKRRSYFRILFFASPFPTTFFAVKFRRWGATKLTGESALAKTSFPSDEVEFAIKTQPPKGAQFILKSMGLRITEEEKEVPYRVRRAEVRNLGQSRLRTSRCFISVKIIGEKKHPKEPWR